MIKQKSSFSVPDNMKIRYEEISQLTDEYCLKNLNEEYAQLSRLAIAMLCREISPINSGEASTWACGIIYALGYPNFLFDKYSKPYMSARDLSSAFKISQGTASSKSKQIRELLKIDHWNHQWFLPSKMGERPGAWIIMLDGLIVDVRKMPREIQEVAYEKGLIPYVPADKSK